MAYVRPNVYPNGEPIPASLPPSYQPMVYGNAPVGQGCYNCKYYELRSSMCSKWDARVKRRWWCDAWETNPMMGKNLSASYFENEEDTITVNVPLMIRLLEYAREDAKRDVDLHFVTERLIELSEEGETLEMENYAEIIGEAEPVDTTDTSQKIVLEIKLNKGN